MATIFSLQKNELWGKNLWLRAKTKANLKPGSKMKVIWNTCEKEHGGEMKSVNENYLIQKFAGKLRKVTPF